MAEISAIRIHAVAVGHCQPIGPTKVVAIKGTTAAQISDVSGESCRAARRVRIW